MQDIFRALLVVLAILAVAFTPSIARAQQDDAPVVAAASDLQFAIKDIAAKFQQETGKQVRLSLGSTGNFARQIRQGAPFQMFMAADEKFIQDLHKDGFAQDAGTLYAIGRIVIKVPPGSPLKADGTLKTLREALDKGVITRFAIAHPDHAPYGMRAKEALQKAGLWERMQPHIVFGENVSQAAQFALSGNAQGGIIALSLSVAPQVKTLGTADLIPAEDHKPLRQAMALLKNAGPVAEQFFAYMQSPPAREIMKAYGFLLPGE